MLLIKGCGILKRMKIIACSMFGVALERFLGGFMILMMGLDLSLVPLMPSLTPPEFLCSGVNSVAWYPDAVHTGMG